MRYSTQYFNLFEEHHYSRSEIFRQKQLIDNILIGKLQYDNNELIWEKRCRNILRYITVYPLSIPLKPPPIRWPIYLAVIFDYQNMVQRINSAYQEDIGWSVSVFLSLVIGFLPDNGDITDSYYNIIHSLMGIGYPPIPFMNKVIPGDISHICRKMKRSTYSAFQDLIHHSQKPTYFYNSTLHLKHILIDLQIICDYLYTIGATDDIVLI